MTNDEQFQLAKHLWATREKFDLFVVGLTFTVLGAAVQTAKFETSNAAQWLELSAWSLLLMSGLLGILRIYLLTTALTFDRLRDDVDRCQQQGRTIRDELDSLRRDIAAPTLVNELARLDRDEKQNSERLAKARATVEGQRTAFYSNYGTAENSHIALFFVSFLVLGVARAHDPLWKLLGWL